MSGANALPHPLLILNAQRQIVFVNRLLLELTGVNEPEQVHGLAPATCWIASTPGPRDRDAE